MHMPMHHQGHHHCTAAADECTTHCTAAADECTTHCTAMAPSQFLLPAHTHSETPSQVWNPSNCEIWVLQKVPGNGGTYELAGRWRASPYGGSFVDIPFGNCCSDGTNATHLT